MSTFTLFFKYLVLPPPKAEKKVVIDYDDDKYDIVKLTEKRLAAENIEKEKNEILRKERQKVRDDEKKQRKAEKRIRAMEREKERGEVRFNIIQISVQKMWHQK